MLYLFIYCNGWYIEYNSIHKTFIDICLSFPISITVLGIKESWAMLEVNSVHLFSLITKNTISCWFCANVVKMFPHEIIACVETKLGDWCPWIVCYVWYQVSPLFCCHPCVYFANERFLHWLNFISKIEIEEVRLCYKVCTQHVLWSDIQSSRCSVELSCFSLRYFPFSLLW